MDRKLSICAVLITLLLCFGPVVYLLCTTLASSLGIEAYSPLRPRAYGDMLLNSVAVAGGATAFSLLVAVPLSLALFKLRIRFRKFFLVMVVGAAVVPLYIYAAAWLGPLRIPLLPFDLSNGQSLTSGRGVRLIQAILVSGLAKVFVATVLMGLSLWGLSAEAEEAAWLETGRRGVLRHVVLRHVVGSLLFAGSIVLGLSLSEIAVTDMLSIRTLAEESYTQFQLTLNPGIAAISGVGAFFPTLIPWLTLLASKSGRSLIMADEPLYATESAVFRDIPRVLEWVGGAGVLIVLAIALGIPLLSLMQTIGSVSTFMSKVTVAFEELASSLLIALLASLATVAVAFPIVYMTRGKRSISLIVAVSLCGLFVPGAVLGIALVRLFNRPGLFSLIYSSPLMLLLGQALRYFPLAVIALWVFLRAVPRIYDEMTAADGITFRQALVHVYVPICRGPLLWTWAMTFLWCIGELDTSLIVCPPGRTTLPIRIFTMMHYGVYADVASACLLLLGTVFVFTTIVLMGVTRYARKRNSVTH